MLPFRFPDGQSAQQIVAQLAAWNWRGAVVGPHGSGKSSLLESLKSPFLAAGRQMLSVTLQDGQCRLPPEFIAALRRVKQESSTLFIIDGYEQLSMLERLRLSIWFSRKDVGLLVTTHAPTRFPSLLTLAPTEAVVAQLVGDLCAEVSTPITRQDVVASHACHGSNVREIFFDLYDRHERRRHGHVRI